MPISNSSNKPSWMANAIPVESTPDKPSWMANAIPVESAPIVEKTDTPPPSWMTNAIPVTEPEVLTDPYSKLRSEMDRGISDRITESPLLISKDITDSDIAVIAQKHGVNPTELREYAPLLGASLENPTGTETRRRIVGILGQTVAMGLPQKLMRTMQTPEMEKALDDINDLASSRKSMALAAGEVAVPGGVIASGAKKLGGKIAASSATGAAYGLGSSKQDEEVSGIIGGAVVGGVLGTAGAGLSKILNRSASQKATTVQTDPLRGGADLSSELEEALITNRHVDDLVAEVIVSGESLDKSTAKLIADTYRPGRAEEILNSPRGAGLNQDAANQQVAESFLRHQARQLANSEGVLTEGDPLKAVRTLAGVDTNASGQGVEVIQNKLRRQVQNIHINSVLDGAGVHTTERSNFLNNLLDKASDAQFVMRAADEKLPGLGIEATHKEVVLGMNRIGQAQQEVQKDLTSLLLYNEQTGVDTLARDGSDIIRKLQMGNKQQLNPQEKKVYKGFGEFYDKWLTHINEVAEKNGLPPLNIKKWANYLPSQLMDYDKLDTVMADRVQNILNTASDISGKQYKDLALIPENVYTQAIRSNPENRETVAFIRMLSREGGSSPADVSMAYKSTFLNPTTRSKLDTVARAALEREDMIPLFARETNLYKLADKWGSNTLNHVFLREGLDKLNNIASLIEKRGMGREAEYIRTLSKDLVGTRAGTMGAFTGRKQNKFYNWVDSKIGDAAPGEKKVWETVRAIPGILQATSNNMYSNYLGAKPSTVITNATQTFTKTLPEFGPKYGASLFFRGAMSVARGMDSVRAVQEASRKMQQMGLMSAEHVSGAKPYLSEGLLRGKVARAGQKAANISKDIVMYPFQMAEKANRAIAFRASEVFVDDLFRGNKLALTALSRLPTSVSRGLTEQVALGNKQEALRIAATHIVNNTQYQYNKAAMSEYGRSAGSLFSAFTKWPTATLGQTREAFQTKGLAGGTKKIAEQLVAPWVLLETANWAYKFGTGKDELSDRDKTILTSGGMAHAAPIGTLGSIVRGDWLTPPAVDMAMEVFIKPWQRGDIEDVPTKMGRALGEAAYTFAPAGAGAWVRGITTDAATLITGEKPEGTGVLGRAASTLGMD